MYLYAHLSIYRKLVLKYKVQRIAVSSDDTMCVV